MLTLFNIDVIKKDIRPIIVDFCNSLIDANKANIKAIFLYGSALNDDFISNKSNINILIILNEIDPPHLKSNISIAKNGRKKSIVPLFMTLRHMFSSTDIFPIEFLEMKAKHILLYGEDVLNELKVERRYIRLQCEQNIKGNLIRVYQLFLEIGIKDKPLRKLLIDSLTSLLPTFRHLIKIKAQKDIHSNFDIVMVLSEIFSLDYKPFNDILDLKQGKSCKRSIESIFDLYIEQLEKLGQETDNIIS